MQRRYVTLDLLRGIAAIGVMLYHNCIDVVQSGYLAVDLFFILSGFVIALSYEDKLRNGLTLSSFLSTRFIRLWPMIAVGSVLGLLAGLAHYVAHPGNLSTLAAQFLAELLDDTCQVEVVGTAGRERGWSNRAICITLPRRGA